MKLNSVIRIAATALVAVSLAPAAFAQAPAAGSRADVKAQTKAAQRAGQLTPAGEAPVANDAGNKGRSTITRAQRKADTKMEQEMGGLTPPGERGGNKPDHMNPVRTPPKNRAEVKSETKAAQRAGTLQPAGEASYPVKDVPKK